MLEDKKSLYSFRKSYLILLAILFGKCDEQTCSGWTWNAFSLKTNIKNENNKHLVMFRSQ